MAFAGDNILSALDLASFYHDQPWLDGIVYLVVFVGLSHAALGSRFEGRPGTALSGGVGLALAVAATVTARSAGFSLADLGPIAWLLLLLVLGFCVYRVATMLGMPRLPAGGLALLGLGVVGSTLGGAVGELLVQVGLGFGMLVLLASGLVLLAGWGTLRGIAPRRAKQPGSPDPETDSSARDAHEEAVPSHDVDLSLLRQLEQLREEVRRHGLDRHAVRLFQRIAGTHRRIDILQHEWLHRLTQSGWRPSQSGLLDEHLRTVLEAASTNSNLFRVALRVAEAGVAAGKVPVVLEAVAKMIQLEREAAELEAEHGAVAAGVGQSHRT